VQVRHLAQYLHQNRKLLQRMSVRTTYEYGFDTLQDTLESLMLDEVKGIVMVIELPV